jgi:uroporphyrinogen decarboxylase
MIKNDLFLRALKEKQYNVRQFGWCVKQVDIYQIYRFCDKYDFFTVVKLRLAAEITYNLFVESLQMLRFYSRISLVIPQAMGIDVEMKPNFGPYLPHPYS